jgi:hypothetical protein
MLFIIKKEIKATLLFLKKTKVTIRKWLLEEVEEETKKRRKEKEIDWQSTSVWLNKSDQKQSD